MGYGMQVDKVEQFQKNMGEVNNWLDSLGSGSGNGAPDGTLSCGHGLSLLVRFATCGVSRLMLFPRESPVFRPIPYFGSGRHLEMVLVF